jgi:NAD+ synthase (glutamine-hydrolysing)
MDSITKLEVLLGCTVCAMTSQHEIRNLYEALMFTLTLHQTHHQIADLETQTEYLKNILLSETPGLHLLPELFLGGYPLQDICLAKDFINYYQEKLELLSAAAKALKASDQKLILFGGLKYTFEQKRNLPDKIENVIYALKPGCPVESIYSKRLLPNYDIFDEKKYYHAGKEAKAISFLGKKIGLLICEDMWKSSIHETDPVIDLKTLGKLDLCINLSASPFNLGKFKNRLSRAEEISTYLSCPFAYVNKVGAEDEILFDGRSFMISGNKVIQMAPIFESKVEVIHFNDDLPKVESPKNAEIKTDENTWESLFAPRLDYSIKPPRIQKNSDLDLEEMEKALCFGLQDYARKNNFKKFNIALSGGIDSALVLALCKLSLKPDQEIEAIYMPGLYSRTISYELSQQMCQKLKIPLKVFPIKFIHSTLRREYMSNFNEELLDLADENIQSRLRGSIIYARSNSKGTMVLNTSNKSEIAVGFSTQYGDSVGALSMLGDLYKNEVYELSDYLNRKYQGIIPQGIIDRPPSAELKPDQVDSDSLPEYPILDALVEGLTSYHLSSDELLATGFSDKDLTKLIKLLTNSEYKRQQFCPIIKLKSKSFGFGHRVPTSKSRQYFHLLRRHP